MLKTVQAFSFVETAIELDKRSWERFAAVEASRIMKTFGIPRNGGLQALEQAFRYRLYAPMNVQQVENLVLSLMNLVNVPNAQSGMIVL